jgi:polygalacturonase
MRSEVVSVDAPFDMPPITIPDFSGCPRISIMQFGAEPDNQVATTQAIARAIDEACEAGGGVVVVPEGRWLTGAVHLRSHVNLHLEKGAVLEFSAEPEDYLPAVQTTWEGLECFNYSPLIYAFNCRNVAVTGEGSLYARLDVWEQWYSRPPAHLDALRRLYDMASNAVPVETRQMVGNEAHLRPQFIQFNRCENVLIEGVSIENSPFWVIHPFLSKDIVIRNVNVSAHGHNNDGVDPEMSRNVLIERCVFDQGDDAVSVKSGRNRDAWRLNAPAKNIVIRDCLVRSGHQLLAVGSELSGGVENVLVENCRVDESVVNLGHLLYIKTNERRGGYVKNIFMRRVSAGHLTGGILGIETDVLYQWRDLVPTHEVRLTPISNIYLEDVQAGSVQYVARIEGREAMPVEDVLLENVGAGTVAGEPFRNRNVIGFACREPRQSGADGH